MKGQGYGIGDKGGVNLALHIVLVEPEIPQNTGNISRTCAVTGCVLHLVGPLGFSTDDRQLKRAGLDYWHMLEIHQYEDYHAFLAANPDASMYYLSTKAPASYDKVTYHDGDYLVFGRETRGLSEELLEAHLDRCLRIPMMGDARSLNLSNAVAIVAYEALRQIGFPGMESAGKYGEY